MQVLELKCLEGQQKLNYYLPQYWVDTTPHRAVCNILIHAFNVRIIVQGFAFILHRGFKTARKLHHCCFNNEVAVGPAGSRLGLGVGVGPRGPTPTPTCHTMQLYSQPINV